ncbi:MAG: hypothetical protein GQ565_12920 [Candidatus Aegiribacteria sp.]|nr:hypothetical protein [Candidatus Aegiribacteria sp.]
MRTLAPFLLLLFMSSSVHGDFTEPVVDSIYVSGNFPVSENKLLSGTGLKEGASLLSITPVQVRDGIIANLNDIGYLDAVVTVQWPLWDDENDIVRISGRGWNKKSSFRPRIQRCDNIHR